jgi:glycosyltransferase involved in cell wall biosynthesis
MRILFVTELWPPNGGSFVFEQVKSVGAFVSATVAVLVPHLPALPRYRARPSPFVEKSAGPELLNSVEVYYLRYQTIPELGRYLNSIQAFRALQRFLRGARERFDLIHAHFAYVAGYAAVRAGRRCRIPTVVTVHGSDINYYTRRSPRNLAAALATIWGLRHAAAITAVSNDLKNKVAALGVPDHRITVVPNGIDESVFFPRGQRSALRRQLQLPETGTIFLYVGNFARVKGLDFLLQAFALVHVWLPQAMLVMVGSGELEAVLKARAQSSGIGQHVIWVGRKPHAEIPFWMSAADLLVLPSLSEGYGLVILEALACGTPAIASQVGSVPEILIAPELGMMVPPGDSAALARAMLEAVGKSWQTEKLVAYARANTWAKRAARFLKVYQSVLTN